MLSLDDDLEYLQYPIGRFQPRPAITADDRSALIDDIAAVPADLRAAVADLTPAQLDTPYRPGGWTIRQVVHHVPDSHINSYVRFKLAATEKEPLIRTYDEAAWARLADAQAADIELSLTLLEALHRRWTLFLRSLAPADWARTFRHPDLGLLSLDVNLQLYAWHGRHHIAHITRARERLGW